MSQINSSDSAENRCATATTATELANTFGQQDTIHAGN
jgi:hypothetical protein